MRLLYTICFYLCLPLLLLRLLWRARRAPDYARRWGERFGRVAPRPIERPAIWVHAVSVGETLAALPLIRQLQSHYPTHDLVVTTTTPTGSARVRAALGDSVTHVYGPYDLPGCVARFLHRVRPRLAIIMETELWPNTIAACARRDIPVVVANARLSAKSARGYARFVAMTREMLQSISLVAAQTQADADRFVRLGARAECVTTTGNIKFDIQLDAGLVERAHELRRRWTGEQQRPIVLAASTHAGEDALLLEGFGRILLQRDDVLLVLVPRHPERFAQVAALAGKQYPLQLHSRAQPVAATTKVLIGDSMGELMPMLGASDLVFMGGTWVNNGGHNFIEPASWGKPILAGPSLFNFLEVSRLLREAGALQVVHSAEEFAAAASTILANANKAQAMGSAGRRIADDNRGALQRLLLQLAPLLDV